MNAKTTPQLICILARVTNLKRLDDRVLLVVMTVESCGRLLRRVLRASQVAPNKVLELINIKVASDKSTVRKSPNIKETFCYSLYSLP